MKARRRFLILFGLALVLPLYAFFVEPYWIEVTHHKVVAPVAQPIKVMQLSDLHIRSFGFRESAVLESMRVEQPDLIAVTGDFVSDTKNDEAVVTFFEKLRAPLGVFIIRGNWEYWKGKDVEPRLRALGNLRFLINANFKVRDDLWIVGLDDRFEGKPDETLAFAGVPNGVARILLFHSPSPFAQMTTPFHVGLTGHTHGGQFRVPFHGPLWLPPFSGGYDAGWFQNGDNRMYVSRGIGNSMLDARFNCRPEISIFELSR